MAALLVIWHKNQRNKLCCWDRLRGNFQKVPSSRDAIAYSNDDNSATVSKLTVQGSHDRQTTDLPVLAALLLSGL